MKVAGEIETYKGGLGDTAMQRAWMRYADANEVPHDHEDEEPFKYGFDAGRNVFKEPSDNSQLRKTQIALRNLYKAVQKSRSANDPLGMATAMEEAGEWF